MHLADGVYLLKGTSYIPATNTRDNTRFVSYVRDGLRSAGISLDKPIKEIYAGKWPYMSLEESANNYQHTYVGAEDFIRGMSVVDPDITSKELLQVLGINYEFEE